MGNNTQGNEGAFYEIGTFSYKKKERETVNC